MDINTLDSNLYHLINQGTANGIFDVLMPFLSAKGYTLIFPFAAYMLWLAYRKKNERDDGTWNLALWTVLISVLACFMSDWIANELKHVLGRIRPCHVEEGVRLLGACTKSASMPSGHATNSFAYAFPLFFMTRGYMRLRWRIYPLVLAGLVAYSRPYTGVHYPGDIVAGALLGVSVAALVIYLFGYARTRYKSRPHTTVLYGSLLVLSVFRIFYILHGPLDLGPDEAHYWEWSRHLDLSYYSKGPMIAYLIALGTAIFGDTLFGVRFLAVILSVLSSLLLYRLVHDMYKDEAVALGSALIYQVIPLFTAFSVIFSIDSPFLFFWILSLYLFHMVIAEPVPGSRRTGMGAWILLGISLGLGLLTKYTMAFFHLGMVFFLVLSDRKYLLRTIKPYAAMLVSLFVFSPVIIWNARHEWVTLWHTAGQTHIADGLNISIRSLGEFVGSQIGIVTPVIFVLIFYALHKLYHAEKGYQSMFLTAFSLPVVAFFFFKSIQGKVQSNWAMTGYITGIIAVAWYYLGSGVQAAAGTRKRKVLLWAGVVIALFVTIVSHYPSIIKLPPKLDPSARLRGWHQLRDEIGPLYRVLSTQGSVLLFSDRYQISSELAFYIEGHPKTYCINLGRRMDQYDLWPGMNEEAEQIRRSGSVAAAKPINGIFVTWGDSDLPPPVAKTFDRFEKKVIKVYDKGTELRVYTVIICYNFKGLDTGAIETY
jgi:membrane-associated phospholipid phosphatase